VKRDTLRNRCDNGRPAVIGGSGLAQDHTHGGQLLIFHSADARFALGAYSGILVRNGLEWEDGGPVAEATAH